MWTLFLDFKSNQNYAKVHAKQRSKQTLSLMATGFDYRQLMRLYLNKWQKRNSKNVMTNLPQFLNISIVTLFISPCRKDAHSNEEKLCKKAVLSTWNVFQWPEKLYCEGNFNRKIGHKYLQKQPPEAFYKKRRSWKFCKIHRKTPVPESLF